MSKLTLEAALKLRAGSKVKALCHHTGVMRITDGKSYTLIDNPRPTYGVTYRISGGRRDKKGTRIVAGSEGKEAGGKLEGCYFDMIDDSRSLIEISYHFFKEAG